MLDPHFIREQEEVVKRGLIRRGIDPEIISSFITIDESWREKITILEELKREQNILSKKLAKERSSELVTKAQILKERIGIILEEESKLNKKRNEILLSVPNIPFDNVPDGKNEENNKILREVGKKKKFDFEPKDYIFLGEQLNLINTEKASEIVGSRFGYLLGDAVLLELALVRFAFERAVKKGFVPIVPPVMIRPEVYENIGRLASDQKDERYYLDKDDLYLVGSSEHTIAPFHMNEVIALEKLPLRYIGFSTCFRREAGSYGRDTKGILRVHQFDKVELFSFVDPEKSEEEHRFLLSFQEELMQALKIPYRVMEICTGDMGWTDARQFDINSWLPGQKTYRETHSCSNTTNYQSRGIKVKYQTNEGKKEFVHTLNGTAFAIGRILIAIMENYQTRKGTIKIPKVLQSYAGISEIKK